ncbi:unannotated protein [freshwater metagenome]|uniref:Unannotated protein n=1 Tax=freshwater metagenome TaxID=449393 RepID=A0A6J7GZT1_9ZZZZ|nr:hypothetical protein [Actinomycetota bacterium]MSW62136.1 hypothetical protein [Actinomycetota bacterium]MSX89215.1 hypothetical protein [Actinomycetota bacterium]MTA57942.1 hypothetical protein [Actinomycetota bacterium]
MRKAIAIALTAIFLLPPASLAMGSGDKFSDAQTGLTYTVYKPSITLGLSASKFQLITCGVGSEQWIYAKYGGTKRYVEIMQTMAGVKCSDPGISKQLKNVKINGVNAKVYVYCDPSRPAVFAKCTTSDIARLGGYLIFTNKAAKNLKPTEIQVQGIGGVTYAQLVTVAKSLKTVTASGNISQMLPPIFIDPATATEVSVKVGSSVVLTVTEPDKWSGQVADPSIATFVPGGDQGTYTTNPALTANAVGTTSVHIIHGSDSFELQLTVTG